MTEPKIYMGSDHRGFALKAKVKRYLKGKGYSVIDIGPARYNGTDDFVDYVPPVCRKVLRNKGMGILICGSGHGMSIAANRIKGIRAALCWNPVTARWAREHNDANVICIASEMTNERDAERTVSAWLGAGFSGEERHVRRIGKLDRI